MMYLIRSRLKKISLFISWLITYLFVYFFYIFILNLNFEFLNILLLTLIFFNFYEIGYYFNDIYSIKKENNPTIRFKKNILLFLENNFFKFIILKILYGFILIYFIDFNKLIIISLLFLTLIIFYIHNYFRNQFNIFTFFILNHLKNIFIPIIFYYNKLDFFSFLEINITFFFLFTLYRSIENASLERFNINKLLFIRNSRHFFRVIYYAFILLFLILNFYIFNYEKYYFLIYIVGYLFSIRVIYFIYDAKIKSFF